MLKSNKLEKLYINEELPSYEDVVNYVCEGREVAFGTYQIAEGHIIEICNEEEDYDIFLVV